MNVFQATDSVPEDQRNSGWQATGDLLNGLGQIAPVAGDGLVAVAETAGTLAECAGSLFEVGAEILGAILGGLLQG